MSESEGEIVEDEVKATGVDDAQEDSRTASFSRKSSKRASPEPALEAASDSATTRPDKRQKLTSTTGKSLQISSSTSPSQQKHFSHALSDDSASNVSSSDASLSSGVDEDTSAIMKRVEPTNPTQGRTTAGTMPRSNARTLVQIIKIHRNTVEDDIKSLLQGFNCEFKQFQLLDSKYAFRGHKPRAALVEFASRVEAQRAKALLERERIHGKAIFFQFVKNEPQNVRQVASEEEGEVAETASQDDSVVSDDDEVELSNLDEIQTTRTNPTQKSTTGAWLDSTTTSVLITNVSNSTKKNDVDLFLSDFTFQLNSFNKKFPGYKSRVARLEFPSRPEAQRAIDQMNGKQLRGKRVGVRYENDEPPTKAPKQLQQAQGPSEEEGEIAENSQLKPQGPNQALPTTATQKTHKLSAHEMNQITTAAGTLTKQMALVDFDSDWIEQMILEDKALVITVEFPSGNAKNKKTQIKRRIIREKLIQLVCSVSFDSIIALYETPEVHPLEPFNFLGLWKTPEAAATAEQFLNTQSVTERTSTLQVIVDKHPRLKDDGYVRTVGKDKGKPLTWAKLPKATQTMFSRSVVTAVFLDVESGKYDCNAFMQFVADPSLSLLQRNCSNSSNSNASTNSISSTNNVASAPRSVTAPIPHQAPTQTPLNAIQNLTRSPVARKSIIDLTGSSPPMAPISYTDLPVPNPGRSFMSQLNDRDRELQTRYHFITNDNDLVFCLICAERGHMSETCPERTCKHCGAVDEHYARHCLKSLKCGKCRERGHTETECTLPLRRTAADGFDCDVCGEAGHPEENCPDLIGSLFKSIANPKIISKMIVSCYACSSSQHWGDDCPQRQQLSLRRHQSFKNSLDAFSARQANKFLLQPMPPAVPYSVWALPPSRGRGAVRVVNLDSSDDTDMVDALNGLPAKAPARDARPPAGHPNGLPARPNGLPARPPPPPSSRPPPLPPGPPPGPPSRNSQNANAAPRLQQRAPPRQQPYRSADGYVPYAPPPSQQAPYSAYPPPPGSYASRRRSRSPARYNQGNANGNHWDSRDQPPGRDYRDRYDGPQQQRAFPPRNQRGGGNAPPGSVNLGRYQPHR